MTISFWDDLDDTLQRGLIVSGILHGLILLVIIFGVPAFLEPYLRGFLPEPKMHAFVPFDIVEIGEITNTRTIGKGDGDDGAIQQAPSPQPKPTPPAAAQAAPPTPTTPSPTAKTEKTTDDAVIPVPGQKPKPPTPAGASPTADPLASVLKNVAKMKPMTTNPSVNGQANSDPQATGAVVTGVGQGTGGSGTKGVGRPDGTVSAGSGPSLGDRLTISEEDALRRQISQCWNMPVGAREAKELIVEVIIEVNPDRTVRSAQIADTLRMATDTYFRAAAESALRALRHPKCTPLDVNPEKYDQWKVIHFNFDPRDML